MTTSTTDQAFKFDKLKMYFGEPYQITNKITITQPTIGQILKLGEAKFFQNLYIFVGNPTMYRLQLWKAGIDWNKISDFDLFSLLIKTSSAEYTQLFMGDIDFTLFERYPVDEQDPTKGIMLYSQDQDIMVTSEVYQVISEYLRAMFNIYPKSEKVKGKSAKEWVIQEETEKYEKEKGSGDSFLLPYISACINHPGFKYKLEELKEVGIYQFMDSVQRLQIYESTVALNSGRYSGMCDMSKVDEKLFNFMRAIE